jgi:lysyl-tRNA synthetase class 2
MLEVYQALANYEDMMRLTERLIAAAAEAALGTTVLDGVDLTPPWPRRAVAELVAEHTGHELTVHTPLADARAACDALDVPYEDYWGAGRLLYAVFDKRVEEHLSGPVFAYGYPAEVSPLAKPNAADPEIVDRFELFVGGREMANAYSELNDPVRQRAMFEAEVALAERGDPEAQRTVDEDYLRALEFGLPPTGGLGIGVDRVVMMLADVPNIREVILFPALRPEARADAVPEAP